jgi:hypothetical protein
VGDLFEYRLTDRVTVRRNESALVPILQAEVEAERVSLWNSAMGIRPRRAVWLTNSSDLTLDGGSVALIEAGAFAGEGLLDTLKPWERRLISYGADLGVLVNAKTEGRSGRLQRVHIANGMLRRESEQRESRTYTMRNQDRRPRAIVIEHPVRDGWKLAGNRPPVESTASAYRFQVGVPAGETAMLVVDEVRLDPMEVAITDVDGEFLSVALQGTDQQPAVERMLKPVFDERRAIAELTASIATRNSEITTIRTDQARLRENMAALQRSSRERRLLERYLRQLDEQETRLDTLKQEIARLTSQQQAAERRLADTIRTLELDLMF